MTIDKSIVHPTQVALAPTNEETEVDSENDRHIMYFCPAARALVSDECLWKDAFGDDFYKHRYVVCVLDNCSLLVTKDARGCFLAEDIDDMGNENIWCFYSVLLSPLMFMKLISLTTRYKPEEIINFYAYPCGKNDIPFIQIDIRKD